MLEIPTFLSRPKNCPAVATVQWTVAGRSIKCWHYLSSRAVTRQVLSAQMSLTSVFGMGTGGPSPQSTPTVCYQVSLRTAFIISLFLLLSSTFLLGDPYRIRTDVNGVRGHCLNHLTNGPFGAPSRTRTGDPLIKSQLLYQLS